MLRSYFALAAVLAATIACVAACTRAPSQSLQPNGKEAGDRPVVVNGTAEEHGHKPGLHGGVIVTIGREEYHAEAVFEQDGTVRLHMLGPDETRIHEVEQQDLMVYLKPEGGEESSVAVLKPDPMPGDTEGMTSRFVGTIPKKLVGKHLHVTVPGLRIEGERFYVRFESPAEPAEVTMPMAMEDAAASELYLTPGGLYTEADIEANGRTTAGAKYRTFRASHDLNPQSGDMLCPITQTKANPQCTWIIGGKTYEFCCPPCIDEFLTLAKEKPEQILAPEEYRKP